MDSAYDTHVPPTFAFVDPPDPRSRTATFYGENVDRRLPIIMATQQAPDPVRRSMFTGEGKPPSTALSMSQVAFNFNIGGRQAVMEDFFLAGKYPIKNLTREPRGAQLPFMTRANIDRPTSAPYGDQTVVPGASLAAGFVSQAGLTYQLGV